MGVPVAQTPLRITLFGAPELTPRAEDFLPDSELPARLKALRPTDWRLLAILALDKTHSVVFRDLLEFLWPDKHYHNLIDDDADDLEVEHLTKREQIIQSGLNDLYNSASRLRSFLRVAADLSDSDPDPLRVKINDGLASGGYRLVLPEAITIDAVDFVSLLKQGTDEARLAALRLVEGRCFGSSTRGRAAPDESVTMATVDDDCLVIDTNVLAVAEGLHPEASEQCVANAIAVLELLDAGKVLAVDSEDQILQEYLGAMTQSQGSGPGVKLASLLWRSRWNGRMCRPIAITPHATRIGSFYEVPEPLHDLDADDLKFVAVAMAEGSSPPIVQAVDTEWWLRRKEFASCGIDVQFICMADLVARTQ
jgi:hypothetical protein